MPPGCVLGSHAHEAAQICFVLEGEYEERTLTSRRTLSPGDVFYRPAAAPHSNEFASESVLTLLVSYRHDLRMGDRDHLQPIPFTVVQRLRRELVREIRRDDDSLWEIEGLGLLLGATIRHWLAQGSSAPPDWIRAAMALIDRRFTEPISLSTIASEVGVHRTTLSAGFRHWCGTSVGEEIRSRRIHEAVRLLRSTTKPISMIALQTGFHDQPHLTRALRRELAVTPAQVRRRPLSL